MPDHAAGVLVGCCPGQPGEQNFQDLPHLFDAGGPGLLDDLFGEGRQLCLTSLCGQIPLEHTNLLFGFTGKVLPVCFFSIGNGIAAGLYFFLDD